MSHILSTLVEALAQHMMAVAGLNLRSCVRRGAEVLGNLASAYKAAANTPRDDVRRQFRNLQFADAQEEKTFDCCWRLTEGVI